MTKYSELYTAMTESMWEYQDYCYQYGMPYLDRNNANDVLHLDNMVYSCICQVEKFYDAKPTQSE